MLKDEDKVAHNSCDAVNCSVFLTVKFCN